LQQPAAKLPLPIWVFMISSHLRPFAFIRGSAFFFKESAGLFADQNMERDAPMDGLEQDAPATSKKRLLRSTIHDPSSSSRSFVFIRG
jgi:hypothetical protein